LLGAHAIILDAQSNAQGRDKEEKPTKRSQKNKDSPISIEYGASSSIILEKIVLTSSKDFSNFEVRPKNDKMSIMSLEKK